jgi:hypothetical protein
MAQNTQAAAEVETTAKAVRDDLVTAMHRARAMVATCKLAGMPDHAQAWQKHLDKVEAACTAYGIILV